VKRRRSLRVDTGVTSHPVAIIGAGQSGISVALSLKDFGVRSVVIERAPDVAAAWRGRYDRLKLNTGRQFSHLPRRPFPRGTPLYPSRDDVVAHLTRHVREAGLEIRLDTKVGRIDPVASGWRLASSGGDVDARIVVVATGWDAVPHLPAWPGRFRGELLHSSAYRNALPYRDKRVLVVGAGSSGLEIAHDLTEGDAAKVWLSIRTPPNIALRSGPAGLPVDLLTLPLYHLPPRVADRIAAAGRLRAFGDLSSVGLPMPDEGPFSRAHRLHVAPTIVDDDVVAAIRTGSIEVVKDVEVMDDDEVVLRDASRLRPDAIIAATGYRRGVDALVGHLAPFVDGELLRPAPWTSARGLYFHGLVTRPSVLGYVARKSRPLARSIAKQLA